MKPPSPIKNAPSAARQHLEHELRLAVRLRSRSSGTLKLGISKSKEIARVLATEFRISNISQIRPSHVWFLFDELRAERETGTLQNYAWILRKGLTHFGFSELALSSEISNEALGIGGRDRRGTHRALTSEEADQKIFEAKLSDEGVSVCFELMNEFGLRIQEALTSPKSFPLWTKTLEKGHDLIDVDYGTKGGKPRCTRIFDKDNALSLVVKATELAKKNGGWLIDSESRSIAITRAYTVARKIGMTGETSPHSLRCSFAHRQFDFYISRGDQVKPALERLATDLGHGHSRITWIVSTYLRDHPTILAIRKTPVFKGG